MKRNLFSVWCRGGVLVVCALSLLLVSCGGGGGGGSDDDVVTPVAESGIDESPVVEIASTNEPKGIIGSEVFIDGRSVTLWATWCCDHEVTQGEYLSVMESNPSYFTASPASGETQENRPVEGVSWYDALVYCNKRSIAEGKTPCYTIEGKTNPSEWGAVPTSSNATWNAVDCNFSANGYRLPMEAEWEYFARGGNVTNSGQTTYSGSNTIDDFAWYAENSEHKTHEVKKKSPNAKGLYDMSGNVWEWCWDWYDTITTDTPSTGCSSGSGRVRRGGSFYHGGCSVAYRDSYFPYRFSDHIGFRVVRTAN